MSKGNQPMTAKTARNNAREAAHNGDEMGRQYWMGVMAAKMDLVDGDDAEDMAKDALAHMKAARQRDDVKAASHWRGVYDGATE